jgi:DNA polymerase-3 subunit beta
MIIKFVVPTNHLKAAALIAAKKDIRYYLNGVHFNNRSSKLRIEATDGCRLVVVTQLDENNEPDVKFIVPDVALTQLPKSPKVEVTFDTDTNKVIVGIVTVSAIDGKFPDVDRVIPKHNPSNSLSDFDWEQIVIGQKVLRLIDDRPKAFYRLGHDGSGVGRMISRGENAAYYVTPLGNKAFT